MVRILGAVIRALVMMMVISAPSFLLPNVPDLTKELFLIIGAIVGFFVFFEYGSTSPGFVDFRFAPPFNRFRIAILGVLLVTLSLICRASISGGNGILDLANQAVNLAAFKYSPVEIAIANMSSGLPAETQTLIAQVLSASFVIAVTLSIGFSVLLWLFRWPTNRADFNIWQNLPTFTPAEIDKTEKKLKRDGFINVILAGAVLYGIPYLFPNIVETLGKDAATDFQTLVWISTSWTFLPAMLFVRGTSIYKLGRILEQAVKRR